MTKYTIVNGTSYPIETPMDIISKLEYARQNNRRVKLVYKDGYGDFTGYTKDGLTVSMYIGRSSGTIKVPLHLPQRRSYSGPALSTNLIKEIIYY